VSRKSQDDPTLTAPDACKSSGYRRLDASVDRQSCARLAQFVAACLAAGPRTESICAP
jgi:hypothetical protein